MPVFLAPLAILTTRKKEKASEAAARATATLAGHSTSGFFSRAFARLVEAQTEKARRRVDEHRRRFGLDRSK